jgi:hypothetical protein
VDPGKNSNRTGEIALGTRTLYRMILSWELLTPPDFVGGRYRMSKGKRETREIKRNTRKIQKFRVFRLISGVSRSLMDLLNQTTHKIRWSQGN